MSGTNTTLYGDWAGAALTSDSTCNTFVGANSGYYSRDAASFNTAVGAGSMANNTVGFNNTACGSSALEGNDTGSGGDYNAAFGTNALWVNQGNNNTALGSSALFSNNLGYNQTGCGCAAGFHDVDGSNNTYLGASSDIAFDPTTNEPLGTFTNSTAVGANVQITASNQIMMGVAAQTLVVPGTTSFQKGISAVGNSTIVGTVTATAFNVTSDHRIKSNVKPLTPAEYSVDGLNPVSYFNDRLGVDSIGLIAHEVSDQFPDLVSGSKDGDNMQSVDYIGLIGVLISEVKQLKKHVRELQVA